MGEVDPQAPGGTFKIRRLGGLDLTSSLEAKFGARSGQVHKIGGKIGTFCHQKTQKLGKSPNLGSYLKFRGQNMGYLSFIFLEANFGAPTRIFRGKIWGQAPRPPNMEVPSWAPGIHGSFKNIPGLKELSKLKLFFNLLT